MFCKTTSREQKIGKYDAQRDMICLSLRFLEFFVGRILSMAAKTGNRFSPAWAQACTRTPLPLFQRITSPADILHTQPHHPEAARRHRDKLSRQSGKIYSPP